MQQLKDKKEPKDTENIYYYFYYILNQRKGIKKL